MSPIVSEETSCKKRYRQKSKMIVNKCLLASSLKMLAMLLKANKKL